MPVSDRTRLATLNARSSRPSSHPQSSALGFGDAVGGLELAQDLRLAHHHRIQAGRHAEQVVDGVLSLVPVKVRLDRAGRHHPRFPQEFVHQRLRVHRIFRRDGNLHAVACGQDAGFRDARARLQGLQGFRQRRLGKSQAFPHLDGRGLVADPCDQQFHGFSSQLPSRACATQVTADSPTTTITMMAAFRPRHPAVMRRNTMAR